MKILVLGGTYFIGKILTQKLLEAGNYEVTLLNRGTKEREIKSLPLNLIKADRTDAESMQNALKNKHFEVVFDISGYNEKDVSLAVSILNGRVSQYIFCSSIAVCQQPPDFWPLTEDHPKCISIEDGKYGFNKWQAESFLWNKWERKELNVTVVRPVYVYGPHNYRQRETLIFERALQGLPFYVRGSGENIIQFGFVEDLAEAMLLMAGNKLAYGEAFNVSGYELVTVSTFIRLAAKAVGKSIEIIYGCEDAHNESDLFPKIYRFADISKAKDMLGIKPRISLSEGLKRAAEWFLKSIEKGEENEERKRSFISIS